MMTMTMKTLFKRTLCRREGCPNNKNLRVRVWRNAKGMLGNDDMMSLKVFQLVLSVSSASCSLRGPELLLPHMPLHFNFWVHFLVVQPTAHVQECYSAGPAHTMQSADL